MTRATSGWFRSTTIWLALTLVAIPASAQTIRGRITDFESHTNLRAVAVVLLDDQGQEVARASTDAAGSFTLRTRRAGAYRLQATLIGYVRLTSEPIELSAREVVHVAMQMSTQAIPVAPLVVTARSRGQLEEFERRRTTLGTGYYLTQADIDRRPIATASTLVLGIPGVSVTTGHSDRSQILMVSHSTIARDPACRANIYIDGMGPISGSVDDILTPAWIAAVEVYPRPASAPIEYMRQQTDCGMVFFWTRERQSGPRFSWKKIAAAAGFIVGGVLLAR